MFNRSTGKYLQTVKVNLGLVLGEEKDEDVYIVLREPKTEWLMLIDGINDKNGVDTLMSMNELLKKCVVNHNFTEDGVTPMKNDEVIDLIYEKIEAVQKAVSEYMHASFFTRAKMTGEGSPSSAPRSSQDEG